MVTSTEVAGGAGVAAAGWTAAVLGLAIGGSRRGRELTLELGPKTYRLRAADAAARDEWARAIRARVARAARGSVASSPEPPTAPPADLELLRCQLHVFVDGAIHQV